MQVKLSFCLLLAALLFVTIHAAPAPDLTTLLKEPVSFQPVSGVNYAKEEEVLGSTDATLAKKEAAATGKVAVGAPKHLYKFFKVLEKGGQLKAIFNILFGPEPKERSKKPGKRPVL